MDTSWESGFEHVKLQLNIRECICYHFAKTCLNVVMNLSCGIRTANNDTGQHFQLGSTENYTTFLSYI